MGATDVAGATDLDGDGYASIESGGDDCDDTGPDTWPGAPEDCRLGIDRDCDGAANLCELGDSDLILDSEGAAYTGLDLQLVDDLDGDGLAELLVGSMVTPWTGGAYLVLGKSAVAASLIELGSSDCVLRHPSTSENDEVPISARFVGDLDERGLGDLVVGATCDATAFLFFGEDLACAGELDLRTADATLVGSNWFGVDANGGDIDGDGREDLMVTDRYEEGVLYVFHGGSIGPGEHDATTSATMRISGTSGEYVTTAGVSAGDLDADGLDDLAIGEDSLKGKVYLFLGASLPSAGCVTTDTADGEFEGQYHHDYAEVPILLDDIGGDGKGDRLIQAHGDEGGRDYLWLGSGSSGWAMEDVEEADVTFVGSESSMGSYAVGPGGDEVGDIDQDGRSDLLLFGGVVDELGRANLFYGASVPISGSVDVADADYRFVSEASGQSEVLVGGVSGGKDVNGDGIDDILLGDIFYASDGITYPPGRAYLIHGW